jgi:hypothetical protein
MPTTIEPGLDAGVELSEGMARPLAVRGPTSQTFLWEIHDGGLAPQHVRAGDAAN